MNPPFIETDVATPCNTYARSKLEMENYLLEKKKDNGHLSVALLRSSIILGPRAPFLSAHDTFLHFCESRGKDPKETTFYTDERRSVVSVFDVVDTIKWFVANISATRTESTCPSPSQNVDGVYNMGGPDSISRYDMAAAVFDHFGYDKNKFLIAAEKKNQPQQAGVASPLDITMNSQKVYDMTGLTSFKSLRDMVVGTLSSSSSQ